MILAGASLPPAGRTRLEAPGFSAPGFRWKHQALQAAEKIVFVSGHDYRAVRGHKKLRGVNPALSLLATFRSKKSLPQYLSFRAPRPE
jgi:hypothetical protein